MMWDPFAEFERLRKQLDKFMEMPSFNGFRQPLIDIKVEPTMVKVFIELPGVNKRDVELNVTKNELEVKTENKNEKKINRKGYYRYERSYAGFYRAIPLPVEVVPEATKAEFDNGVLTVTLKRAKPVKKEKGVKIKIK